jgi:hypothetical protein
MSTKFEQLLDLIVNEESEKAQELFHAIVVEKSREIYENLIAEEAEEEEMDESADDEEMDEAKEEEDESVEEGAEEDEEEMDESMDLEDSYSMEADDEHDPMSGSGDATDEFGSEIGGDEMGGEEEHEADEDSAIMDIKTAIQELEAAFAELEQAQGGEKSDMGFGSDEEPKMDDEDEGMMMGMHEGRRVTREYVEKVGNDWDKSGSQKTQGQYAGAGTGDKDGGPQEGRSPVSSGKGKPTTGATAANILKHTADGTSNTGTSPTGKAGGFLSAAKDMGTGNGNVPGGKMGVKNLSKVAGGHGAEKKGSGPGPVGSGTGDKAGQTSVGQVKSPINGAPNRNA